MMTASSSTIHASAVLVGAKAVLIRGQSGAGKSTLAWNLIQAGLHGVLPFARLVADDRAHIDVCAGRLIVRPVENLAGLIEIRGLGIRRVPYEPFASLGWVIDLEAPDAARYPSPEITITSIEGISLPRLPVGAAASALSCLTAFLTTPAHEN